ncbi:MFS transporter, partial [Chloroflexota bacterium]
MTDLIVNNGKNKKSPAFEWWMISNVALGAGFSAFVSLLIPPYVTGVTGNATDAGVVMAIISLAAIMGPILGGFADRYRAHRLIMSLGVLGMALGFLAYGISAQSNGLFALDAILIGVSIAALSAVGPVFIVGAGLSQELEAKRMTIYSLVAPVGQVLGGVIMGAAASASWSYNQRFLLAAVIMFLCAVITWFSSKKPSERIQIAEPVTAGEVKKTQS